VTCDQLHVYVCVIHCKDIVTSGVRQMALVLGGLYMYFLSFISALVYDRWR